VTDGFVDPLQDVDGANAQIAALLTADSTVTLPVITPPVDGFVRLPGGLVQNRYPEPPVLIASEATVRELNGADEEAIYKVRRNPLRLLTTILTCGTEMLGDHHPNASLLKDLLIGDREALILGIRRATYGDEIELGGFTCPGCGETLDLKITLDDIPIKTLGDPINGTKFNVNLWKGGYAKVRLPNGHDQEAVAQAGETATDSEINSVMLSRCVQSTVSADGEEHVVAGNVAAVNALGLKDRKAILTEINARQPGPRYDEVKFTHDSCGKESPLLLTVGDLFREL
jgi:hypothetical protein